MTDAMRLGVVGDASDATFTIQQRLVIHVRTVLCGNELFPSFEVDTLLRRFKCGISGAKAGRMATWVPRESFPVLLVGSALLGNIVIACKSGIAYSMAVEIPPLGAGVVIVGNCTMNHDDSFRVLIYDAEGLPATNNNNNNNNNNAKAPPSPDAVERYDRLRSFFPCYFERSESARCTFVLQWLGFYEHALSFLGGGIDVGHTIGGLVCTTEDALLPVRPVAVQVPCLTIRKFQEK
jgi:hypothetical protein